MRKFYPILTIVFFYREQKKDVSSYGNLIWYEKLIFCIAILVFSNLKVLDHVFLKWYHKFKIQNIDWSL